MMIGYIPARFETMVCEETLFLSHSRKLRLSDLLPARTRSEHTTTRPQLLKSDAVCRKPAGCQHTAACPL